MSATPTIPRCSYEHRMGTIGVIALAFTNDAAATIAHLVEIGARPEDAVELTREGYRDWVLSIIGKAIDEGVEWAELLLQDAAA